MWKWKVDRASNVEIEGGPGVKWKTVTTICGANERDLKIKLLGE